LLDRAFDRGLITVTPEFKVKVSPSITSTSGDDSAKRFLWAYDNRPLRLPSRFVPEVSFLKYHNEKVFVSQ
jgi:hypothetical protein